MKIDYNNIPNTLKLARINAGISQKEAAARYGVCATHLSAWEKGKMSIKITDFLGLVCDIYGYELSSTK